MFDKFVDDEGKPIPFIIREVSMKEIKEIRNRHRSREVYRDKRNNGRPIVGGEWPGSNRGEL